MELHEALTHIETIRAGMVRAELFRGYRAVTVGSTGILGLVAAAVQPFWVPDPQQDFDSYLQLWVVVAAISLGLVAVELFLRWQREDSQFFRRQTLRAAEQFLPCVLAGAVLTWTMPEYAPASVYLLPGLWAMLFSLGVFASLRHLPASARWVGAYYLVAATACIVWARGDYAFSPWAMAATFGGGQLLTGGILYWTLERAHAET